MRRRCSALRFVIVGDGPVRAALQRAHPDLLFCGVQTGAQLATHYASGDVFLVPSETETFGNVVLEAMASGLAVVAYDYAAARTHITHGKSGVLVPYADSRAFVESAAALVRAPRSVLAMRGRAREETTSVDWPSVVRQFEMLLSGALLESRISMSGEGARAVMLRRGAL
jgi:glycosyltransferase involved in cell wall biosynthesis